MLSKLYPNKQVYIHSPFEYPWNIGSTFKVSTNMKVDFNIMPKVTKTTDSLRVANIRKRKCYFGNEPGLDFFKHYNQNNCELECYSKESQKTCYCTEFWIPASKYLLCASIERRTNF